MKKLQFWSAALLLAAVLIFSGATFAQASIEGTSLVIRETGTQMPKLVRFQAGKELPYEQFDNWAENHFQMGPLDELRLVDVMDDQIGMRHYRYRQFHAGHEVFGAMIIVHTRSGKVESLNGHYLPVNANISTAPAQTEQAALQIALQEMDAERYKWEVPGEDDFLKMEQNDPNATFFPKGELTYIADKGNFRTADQRLAWKFNIYSVEPVAREEIFVDALTGEIQFRNSLMCHTGTSQGTAATAYSGQQDIVTDSVGAEFRLRDSSRSHVIHTLNMQSGNSHGASVDFTDGDNFWDNINADQDEYATDAHWAGEMTSDYYLAFHNRSGVDGNGRTLRMYVHAYQNWVNASWDGSRVSLGDGNGGSFGPATCMDVVAHEITHGVTDYSADLIYSYESGALNESFSDIFGALVEAYAKPSTFNWRIGEDWTSAGNGIRSMADPTIFGDPATYLGPDWFTGSGDNGGVHINSGVQNRWFYLLVTGESGTNDVGNAYAVNGLGLDTAGAIAYRNLNFYLTPISQYEDARLYSIQSAIDLYGNCSVPMQEVMNAWQAVNVGGAYSAALVADFEADETAFCSNPAEVTFTNESTGGIVSYEWKFGDGATDNGASPSHTYTFPGTYDVTLIITDCAGNSDTALFDDYIIIDPNQICAEPMPNNSQSTTQACEGILKDSGGDDDYLENNTGIYTITPANASVVTLSFVSFDFATAGDYIAIYDGPDDSSPLIDYYNGNTLPNGGTITSTGQSITIKEVTNGFNNFPGFELNWSCQLVGVEEEMEQLQAMEVFPNPTTGIVNLHVPVEGSQTVQVDVLDVMGRVVFYADYQAVGALQTQIGLQNLSAGVYSLRVSKGGVSVTRKLVRQ